MPEQEPQPKRKSWAARWLAPPPPRRRPPSGPSESEDPGDSLDDYAGVDRLWRIGRIRLPAPSLGLARRVNSVLSKRPFLTALVLLATGISLSVVGLTLGSTGTGGAYVGVAALVGLGLLVFGVGALVSAIVVGRVKKRDRDRENNGLPPYQGPPWP